MAIRRITVPRKSPFTKRGVIVSPRPIAPKPKTGVIVSPMPIAPKPPLGERPRPTAPGLTVPGTTSRKKPAPTKKRGKNKPPAFILKKSQRRFV